jgi:hypothetical protein
VRRSIAILLLIVLIGLTWIRSERPAKDRAMAVRFVPLVAKEGQAQADLAPFRLDGVWHIASRSQDFGSYSALLAMPDQSLLAFSDNGRYLRFAPPGAPPRPLEAGPVLRNFRGGKRFRDVESASREPHTGRIWLGLEGTNAVLALSPELEILRQMRPRAIAEWGSNSGPEAMTRLPDGRFLLLREGTGGWFENRRHEAAIFESDPTTGAKGRLFPLDGPHGFSPTDMTTLPDGRLLILMRRLAWPMPLRFAGRLAIGDPADIQPGKAWNIREVARLASDLPGDNFEGIAVAPSEDGRLIVWIISDDNFSNLQRTILWKLSVDPQALR